MIEEKRNVRYQGKDYSFSLQYRGGEQELLFFIHGLGYSKEDYRFVWGRSELENYSILAIDLIGFGQSSKPNDYSYTIEEQAELCRLLLEQFPEKRVHIVAHSVGGGIGVLLSPRLGVRLASIVSIEGNLIGEDCGLISRATASVPLETFESEGFPARYERLKARGEDTYGHEQSSPVAFYRMAASVVAWSDSGKLREIFLKQLVPKAYFYGEKNKQLPVLQQLDDVPLYEISQSGHSPMWENAEEFFVKLCGVLC